METTERTWIRVGGTAGVLAAAGYSALQFLPLPEALRRLVFFFIPVAGVLFVIGLNRLLKAHHDSVKLQIATQFGVIGFAIMNMMAVVQLSIHIWMNQGVPAAKDDATREMLD